MKSMEDVTQCTWSGLYVYTEQRRVYDQVEDGQNTHSVLQSQANETIDVEYSTTTPRDGRRPHDW